MIPGRETRMSLEPEKPGAYRGQCTEFCGESHAFMAFGAVVMEPDAFDAWLADEAEDAVAPGTATQERGKQIFLSEGCGGCHQVRGTAADGQVGPDLTHLAGRTTLAAGSLPLEATALRGWIRNPAEFKPGVEMPAYSYLSENDLDALTAYLMSLK